MNINKKLVSFLLVPTSLLFISAAIILGIVGFKTVYMPYKVRADREPYKLVLDASKTPFLNGDTSFQNKDKDLGTRNIISFINGKYYAAGLCTLQANEGWIYKKDNERSNALTKFYATGTGTLKIYTSFDGDYEDHGTDDLGYNITPYIYDYVLGTDQEIAIVGNYFKIQAVDNDADIISIQVDYDCVVEDSLFSGVSYSNEDNYISYSKAEHDGTWYENFINVKLHSTRSLNASNITMRNQDKVNQYTVNCTELTNDGNNNYTAKFSLTNLNANTGLWTQFTYVPRIYIDNKRVDGTENGNIHANGSISTSIVKNAASDDINVEGGDCAYKMTDKGWGITLSWVNNLNQEVSNKGMRFTNIGSNHSTYNTFDFNKDKNIYRFSEDNNYLLLEGYVETEESRSYIMSNLNNFTLYSNNGSISSTPDVSKSSSEGWNSDGWKINLWFNISAADNQGAYAIGLKYDDIPYIIRNNSNDMYIGGGAGNSGLLRTQYSINDSIFDTDYRYPGDWSTYNYHYKIYGAYNWIWVSSSNSNKTYSIYWTGYDWVYNNDAVLICKTWKEGNYDETKHYYLVSDPSTKKNNENQNVYHVTTDTPFISDSDNTNPNRYDRIQLIRCKNGTTPSNINEWNHEQGGSVYNYSSAAQVSQYSDTRLTFTW